MIGYFCSEAFRGMKNNIKMTVSCVIAIAACIVLLGSTVLLYDIANNTIVVESQKNQYLAYVSDSLTDREAYELQSKLMEVENIASVEFISNDTAKMEFAEYLGSDALAELPSDIFRHRYALTFIDGSHAEDTLTRVGLISGIADVSGSTEVSEGFERLQEGITAVSVAVSVLLFFISIVVISNTMSYSMDQRAADTRIMRLCGVSEGHIRIPLVIEGILIGLLASLLAFFLQWVVYDTVYKALSNMGIRQLLEMPLFGTYMLDVAKCFVVAGVGLGLVGGILGGTTRKPTRKIEKKEPKRLVSKN